MTFFPFVFEFVHRVFLLFIIRLFLFLKHESTRNIGYGASFGKAVYLSKSVSSEHLRNRR